MQIGVVKGLPLRLFQESFSQNRFFFKLHFLIFTIWDGWMVLLNTVGLGSWPPSTTASRTIFSVFNFHACRYFYLFFHFIACCENVLLNIYWLTKKFYGINGLKRSVSYIESYNHLKNESIQKSICDILREILESQCLWQVFEAKDSISVLG